MDNFFSGWVEACPTRTDKVSEVVKLLLKEITPTFGLSHSIQNNSGSSFTSEISEKIGQVLKYNGSYMHLGDHNLQERLTK